MIALENRTAIADEFKALADQVLAKAKARGATAAELNLSKGAGLSVEVRMGEVDKLQYHRDQSASISVYFGHRQGSASSNDFSLASLEAALEAACRIARYTAEDSFNGLADAELMAQSFPDLDLYHPWAITVDQAIELALATEGVARGFDPRISNSEGAGVDSYAGLGLYANTHGFRGLANSTRHSLSCAVVAKENGCMQRDYWYSTACFPDGLASAEAVGIEAARRTIRRLNGRGLSTREVPVLYVPELARGLIGSLISALGGGAQYRKTSFLLNSIGQQVLPDFVQLRERPFIPRAAASRAFDSEGVAPQERAIILDGVVQDYFLSSYSARKLGLQSTGSAGGNSNLILADTGASFDDLMQQMGTGLLITELMGGGVNGITGDYSRGAAGFWIENGEIQYPVEEITVAGNLKTMYQDIQGIGTDLDQRGAIQSGSILIDRMTIAGQ